jgi:hypothetical protein
MDSRVEIVPIQLTNGKVARVEATILRGEEEVAARMYSFNDVTTVIEGIAEALVGCLEKVQPHKASIEFGVEIAAESGQLIALLVKGGSKANLKVSLEWQKQAVIIPSNQSTSGSENS